MAIVQTGEDDEIVKRNSHSEPDLVTAGRPPTKSGFPPGTTVDELWLYRRKKPTVNLWPQNHLELPEGSFERIKSEYTRRFKNYYDFDSWGELNLKKEESTKPVDSLKVEGSREFRPEYHEKFIEYPIERVTDSNSLQLTDSVHDEMTQKARPHLIKRPTNLKLEGEFYSTTENAEKFIEYLLTRRPDLIRRATTLKLEGAMETKTENREQYVPHEYQSRPPLCKKITNLHLEGDFLIVTEKQDQFVPHEVQKRPPLMKMSTNLHVEGELELIPEYRREFIEYKIERSKPALPVNNLKTDGFYDVPSTALQQQIHPQIPFLRGGEISKSYLETESKTQFVEKPFSRAERTKVANNLQLQGSIDMNPEYRNAYIDFKKLSPPRSRRVSPQIHLKSEGEMDIKPEYSSSYVEFPRQRPLVRRPECSLSSEGDLDHMTEKKEKYISFPSAPKASLARREPQLKLEGDIECEPEYRKAYRNHLIREKLERKCKPMDNLGVEPRRALEEEAVVKTAVPQIELNAPKADSSASPSVPPSPKLTPRQKPKSSLSQIENSVFGPQLTVPRSKSKTLPRSRNASPSTDSDASRPRNKKFGNPIRVENLANRSPTPLPLIDVSARNKWMRDSSVESSSAFVVLDREVNNNLAEKRGDRWMPSWHN